MPEPTASQPVTTGGQLQRRQTREADQQAAGHSSRDRRRDGKIRNEKDLERYQAIFADAAFWKKLGEEYQNPLIVTGTVLFTPHQTAGFVTRNREVYDPLGRARRSAVRTYMERKGFILEPKFIFIDGRTGATLYSERSARKSSTTSQQNTPALSSYFELMDQLSRAS